MISLKLSVLMGLTLIFHGVLIAHSQRLVSVQSMLKQTDRYRTFERDLMDLQERKLFEYFLVVALHKTKAGAPYLPEVTQQFPLKVACHLTDPCYWSEKKHLMNERTSFGNFWLSTIWIIDNNIHKQLPCC